MRQHYLSFLFFLAYSATSSGQQFRVNYSPSIYKESFTGNIILYLSKENKEPKDGDVGFESFPCYRLYVQNIKPGNYVIIADNAISYPVILSDIEKGEYFVQAVWDRNVEGRSIAASPGNIYSKSQKVLITKNRQQIISIQCNDLIAKPAFKETDFVKELKVPSALLTNFNHKSITVDAAVLLPQNYYTSPSKKYPVLFTIAGFGGNYQRYSGNEKINSTPIDTTECITVYLDGNCSSGHSTYANSDNNGPWGDALTQEFIPALEKQFRCNGALLLKGHSSGGFASLWLQTHYPKVFAGCAASSPDPVDFRCFFSINLYEDKNMYYDKDSSIRHLGNISGVMPFLKASDFYRMENVINRGEQFHSYDAMYSRKDGNGNPRQICNPATGEINAVTLEDWKRYDISLYLVANWNSLQPDLTGKVRLSAGLNDNYFLNTSVSLLEQEMKKLNSKFVFGYYPGDHITVQTPAYKQDQSLFLEQKYLDWKVIHPASGD